MKSSSYLFLIIFLFSNVQGESGSIFEVTEYGANGDGITDSTKAFLDTWKEACASSTPATMKIPGGVYLIMNVLFSGICNNPVTVEIVGTIVAPVDYSRIVNLSYWIKFKNIDGLWIKGGTLDAKGEAYWNCKSKSLSATCPSSGPTSLTLQSVTNGKISGLTSTNSLQIHISIHKSTNTSLSNIMISAPDESPNTDGIHVQASNITSISSSIIGTGDDCISIGPGTFTTSINNISCGPGHGISIGSLARNVTEAGVEDLKVSDSNFTGTTNGVRIKTWANPSNGYVYNITYSNLIMNNVRNPIIIDQKYCPHKINCPTQSSGIKINNVKYQNIKGTSATKVAMTFNGSLSNPCTNIVLEDISLSYIGTSAAKSYCENVEGTTFGTISPKSCY